MCFRAELKYNLRVCSIYFYRHLITGLKHNRMANGRKVGVSNTGTTPQSIDRNLNLFSKIFHSASKPEKRCCTALYLLETTKFFFSQIMTILRVVCFIPSNNVATNLFSRSGSWDAQAQAKALWRCHCSASSNQPTATSSLMTSASARWGCTICAPS